MSDRVNNELLSAYLDGEVTAEERAEVEEALVASASARSALETLRQVQARMRALPRLSLPADFHERVVQEAERRRAEEGLVTPAAETTKASPGRSAGIAWGRYAAVVVSVAALVMIAVLVAGRDGDTELAGGSAETEPESVQPEHSLPGDTELVAADPRPFPKYVMVFDLAITKKGQDADLFGKGLRDVGIAFDPRDEGVTLGKELRTQLLESRIAVGLNGGSSANERFDVVDMVYIRATPEQFDELFRNLRQQDQVRTLINAAVLPETLRVFRSVSEQTRMLAQAEPAGTPPAYAYRVNVGFTLHSSRSGFLAKFPTPGLDIKVLDGETNSGSLGGFNFPIPLNLGGQPARPAPAADDDAQNADGDLLSELVIIRRNLVDGFPRPEPAGDVE